MISAQTNRWQLDLTHAIAWNAVADLRLPHQDFIEQGGRRAGQVVTYRAGEPVLARVWSLDVCAPQVPWSAVMRHRFVCGAA